MNNSWRHPGLRGAVLYSLLSFVCGGLVTVFSRFQLARQRGRVAVAQKLPKGPLIVVANHTSVADGIFLALACRRLGRSLRLLAAAGVFRIGVVGSLIRRLGFIPVHRGTADAAGALDSAAAALQAGEAIGLFPEGRISRHAENWPERGKTGAVRLALRTGAPIVPVALAGAHEVVGLKAGIWPLLRSFVLTPQVQVLVGDPIDIRALADGRDDETAVRALTDIVMATLVDQVEELRGQVAEHPFGAPREDAA